MAVVNTPVQSSQCVSSKQVAQLCKPSGSYCVTLESFLRSGGEQTAKREEQVADNADGAASTCRLEPEGILGGNQKSLCEI